MPAHHPNLTLGYAPTAADTTQYQAWPDSARSHMCSDPACDSPASPPPGEQWCPHRIDLEYARALTGYPMPHYPDLDLQPGASR